MLRLPALCAHRAALALLALSAAVVPPAARAIECLDNETLYSPSVTHLDFANSTVTNNTLHLPGGQLRYDGVGIVNNRNASLIVTDASGHYADIKAVWDSYPPPKGPLNPDRKNGKVGNLPRINLQLVRGDPESGQGIFNFCLVDQETSEAVTVETLVFTIYDLDSRKADGKNRPPGKEQAFFDGRLGGNTVFQMMPDAHIEVGCEDGTELDSSIHCASGARTRFGSEVFGRSTDNPNDPNTITDEQLNKAVAFTMHNTTCWEFEFDYYCPIEQPGFDPADLPADYPYDRDATRCSGNILQGGNFIFGGISERLILEGDCFPPETDAPSLAPSPVTSSPSASIAPTSLCVRMVCCYDCSCCGPGTSWNQFTDTCMVDTESITGDDDDTCDYPVPRGQCYDETVSLEEDACGEGTTLEDDPDYPPGESCLCYGDHIRR